MIPRGDQVEAVFEITFSEPMDTSHLIFRAWDHDLHSTDAKFLNAIEIVTPQEKFDTGSLTIGTGEGTDEGTDDEIIPELIIDKEILNKWAGFSDESVSDSEILSLIGFEGDRIPSWYKEYIVEWMIKNEFISETELNFVGLKIAEQTAAGTMDAFVTEQAFLMHSKKHLA